MTYVSRRARITVPRWPNDFDPEFLFRVGRRCDGRLKRHSSCLDLRAWINDNCVKHEYLLELMSDGEVSLKPPLQLYGRFIPVPLLFKLLQNSGSESRAKNTDWEKIVTRTASDFKYEEKTIKAEKSSSPTLWGDSKGNVSSSVYVEEETSFRQIYEEGPAPENTSAAPISRGRKWDPFEMMEYYTSGVASRNALVEGYHPLPTSTQSRLVVEDNTEIIKSRSASQSQKSESEGDLTRLLWEKNLTEKNLFKSVCLLSKAMGKLERIDNIIQVANEENEKMRKGEIQEAFHRPRINCIFIQGKKASQRTPSPVIRYRVKSPGDPEKQEALKCSELLRQISGLREKLKKNQECQQKINEEITMSQKEAECENYSLVTELNDGEGDARMRKLQKKLEKLINHRGKLLSEMCQALTNLNNLKRSRNSRVDVRQRSKSGETQNATPKQGRCSCGCKIYQSSDSERAHCSESRSSSENPCRQAGLRFNRDDGKNYYYSSTENLSSGQRNVVDQRRPKTTETMMKSYVSNSEFYKDSQRESQRESQQEREVRKSIIRFCCPDPPCKEDPDAYLNASEKYLRSGQSSPSRWPLASSSPNRPSTSPTTKRERLDASEERQFSPSGSTSPQITERRVKSETTMKEIEKTLRNYEQRLSDMDGLEYKVEEWKRKLLEAHQWRRNSSRIEAQLKREKEDERNKATTEINGLFTQNYELKKQVRQLTDKSREQAKKIQNMKSSILKARELESEAEELKKELSEYRNSYEHQRKCISKWESVVALQRKEIENLMNHIRKLTTEKKEPLTLFCHDRKCVQRTRSCSPVTLVDCQTFCRPQTYNPQSDEENGSCCCQDFRQPDSRRNQLRCLDKNFYSLNEREDWCT